MTKPFSARELVARVEAHLKLKALREAGEAERQVLLDREQVARREAEEKTEIVETINRIGQRLAAETELTPLVQAFTDEATKLTGAQFGAFFYNVVDERGESYTLYTIAGVPRAEFEKFPLPRNTELFGPTFRGERVIRLDDVKQDPRYGKNAPHHGMPRGHLPVTSYFAVPVVSRTGRGDRWALPRPREAGDVPGAAGAHHGRGGGPARHRHRQRAAARQGAAGPDRGRGGQPGQGRVPGRAVPRAAHAAQRRLRLGRACSAPARSRGRRSPGRST